MAGAHERPKKPGGGKKFDARSYTQRLVVPRDADPRAEARRRGAGQEASRPPLAPDAPASLRRGRTLYRSGRGNAPRRRKRRRGPTVLAVLLAALLALAAGLGAYLLLSALAGGRGGPSALAPAGAVKAMAVDESDYLPAPDAAGRITAEALAQHAEALAARAKGLGLNALLVPAGSGGGALCRVRGWQADARLAGGVLEDLLAPADPLAACCDAAGQAGLTVYVLAQEDGEALARLWDGYPVAGIYTRAGSADGGALYTPLPYGEAVPALPAVTAAGGETAGQFFVAAVADQAAGTPAAGAVFEDMALADAESLGLMASALDGVAEPVLLGYTPGGALAVSYPADGAWTYSSALYVMGTAQPGEPVTLNGQPVAAQAPGGSWAQLVNLPEQGMNEITVAQGASALTLHIERRAVPEPAPLDPDAETPRDGTAAVAPGTFVRLDGLITSLLYDPADDGAINETARRGAVARVVDCKEVERGGTRTWAYQLAGGDWVPASKATVLDEAPARASFTGAAASPFAPAQTPAAAAENAQPDGRTETLAFQGAGTPLAYTNQYDDTCTLSLKFYDTDLAADFAVTGSDLVRGVAVEPFEGGSELILSFDEPLWGHLIAYEEGTVQIVLKARPRRAADPARPLEGVSVLLDAGHGGTDVGAVGVGGQEAPMEKDVNLAVAAAAKARLEQLGAAVHMIRGGDTFLSLDERNEAISALAPDFFIAVHHNSMAMTVDSTAVTGVECYYFYDSGQPLAQALVQRVSTAAGRPSRGDKWGYYYVTRNTLCPAVLLETGFVVNPAEYEQLCSEQALWATGDAIARSVLALTQ